MLCYNARKALLVLVSTKASSINVLPTVSWVRMSTGNGRVLILSPLLLWKLTVYKAITNFFAIKSNPNCA